MIKIPTLRYVFARKGLSKKNGKGVIEMCITYDRRRKYISTGIAVAPHHWKNEKIVGAGDDPTMNRILSTMRSKALKIIADQVEAGKIDVEAIPRQLQEKSVTMTFLDYMFKRMEERNVSEPTHKSYESTFNRLAEFGRIKLFRDVTEKNIRAFHEWLHAYTWTEKGKYGEKVSRQYTQASIYKLTSNLSIFISDAVRDGYLKENPYVTKKLNEYKGDTRIEQYLTAEEVERLEQKEMPTVSLTEVRDLFLLQCYTGLAYADLMEYDFTQLRESEGMQLCTGRRQKTNVKFAFVIDEKGRELLARYDYCIPKLPNQKYNLRLKVVGEAVGIEKPLTTHMGRRTAGSVWLNSGIPIEIVSRCLGHSSISMTQRAYAQILDDTILKAFRRIKNGEQL